MSQDVNTKYSLSHYQEDGDYSDNDPMCNNFKPYQTFYDNQCNFTQQNLPSIPPIYRVEPDYSGSYQDQINVNLCTAVPFTNCCHQYFEHGFSHKRRDVKRTSHHPGHRNIQDHDCHGVKRTSNVKRYPVTVGAPKYYRKSTGANSLLKKPSALCLPLASQQDPETVFRKQKRHNVQEFTQQQSSVGNKEPELPPHEMDSEGDFNVKIPDLNELLKMFENENLPHEIKSKSDLTKIAKFLKPKVPSSVKAKLKATKFSESKTANQKVAEVLDDSLEKLLSQLKKCEAGGERSGKPVNEEKSEEHEDIVDKVSKTQAKSFNYEDINNKMKRKSSTDSVTSIQNITDKLAHSLSSGTSTGKPRSRPPPRPPLDDHCALELHRSKSYIVSLIDKALSKELGTVPGERTRRKFDDMNPKKAASTLNRHSNTTSCKSDKDLMVEITTALTDSILSNATAPTEECHPNNDEDEEVRSFKSRVCCCNTEEPSYIKHLKQLRWGHLKHIQREVRRLEDLERFLDSCSIHTIPEM